MFCVISSFVLVHVLLSLVLFYSFFVFCVSSSFVLVHAVVFLRYRRLLLSFVHVFPKQSTGGL